MGKIAQKRLRGRPRKHLGCRRVALATLLLRHLNFFEADLRSEFNIYVAPGRNLFLALEDRGADVLDAVAFSLLLPTFY